MNFFEAAEAARAAADIPAWERKEWGRVAAPQGQRESFMIPADAIPSEYCGWQRRTAPPAIAQTAFQSCERIGDTIRQPTATSRGRTIIDAKRPPDIYESGFNPGSEWADSSNGQVYILKWVRVI